MQKNRFVRRSAGELRTSRVLLQVAALAIIFVWALSAHAGDTRAVMSRVPPNYPELAKRMHIVGDVQVEATIDANGKVKSVKPVSGNHMLQEAAADAVKQWKFVPADGDSVVTLSLHFGMGQ